MTLPKVIFTSVVRSSQQSESHGGCYIVDLEKETFVQTLDCNDDSINWEGRGGERGLRGIALNDGYIYMANSEAILVFDREFELIES